jgi:hypothetical protein
MNTVAKLYLRKALLGALAVAGPLAGRAIASSCDRCLSSTHCSLEFEGATLDGAPVVPAPDPVLYGAYLYSNEPGVWTFHVSGDLDASF